MFIGDYWKVTKIAIHSVNEIESCFMPISYLRQSILNSLLISKLMYRAWL